MSFSGKFTITKRDNIQYNYFRMKRKLTGLALMTFILLGILVTLIRYGQGISVANAGAVGLIAGVAGAALMVGVNLVSAVLRVNNLYQQGKMSDFTVHYIIDKNGVHAKSERGDTDFGWIQIYLARETRNAIYLVAGESRAVVIPKGQIVNDGVLNAIRALLKKYVVAGRAKVA
ncbi:MAG: YcxB family protein [Eubacteriales bacterium]|nr:YcxB family protein [Eubacteriales bacterium]